MDRPNGRLLDREMKWRVKWTDRKLWVIVHTQDITYQFYYLYETQPHLHGYCIIGVLDRSGVDVVLRKQVGYQEVLGRYLNRGTCKAGAI